MLAQGWITHSQLQHALNKQKAEGGRIGDWLIAECGVQPQQVTRGLSMQWSCPVLMSRGFIPEAMAMLVPKIFVEDFNLLPLRLVSGKLLYLGFEDRLDASVSLAMEQMFGVRVESGLVPTEEYAAARDLLLAAETFTVSRESNRTADGLAARITAILEQKQPVASKLVRVHNYLWLRLWLEGAKASPSLQPRDREDILDYVFTVDK